MPIISKIPTNGITMVSSTSSKNHVSNILLHPFLFSMTLPISFYPKTVKKTFNLGGLFFIGLLQFRHIFGIIKITNK